VVDQVTLLKTVKEHPQQAAKVANRAGGTSKTIPNALLRRGKKGAKIAMVAAAAANHGGW